MERSVRESDNDSDRHESHTFEVFVAGIPATADIDSVYSYFRGLGHVKELELLKIGKKQYGKKPPKKFYKLRTDSAVFYGKLLERPGPMYQGRRLFCQVFKSGDDLVLHSEDINARRVVVKEVPLSTLTDELRDALMQAGGDLEMLYEYKSELVIETDYSKVFKTYSATFGSKSLVLTLIENRTLRLPSGPDVLIEKFIYRNKGDQNFNPKPLEQEEPPSKFKSFKYNVEKSEARISGFVVDDANQGKGSRTKKTIKDSAKNQTKESSQNPTQGFPEWMIDGCKPTSAKYYLSKKVLNSGGQSMTGNYKQSNLRFNILYNPL
jgi:hypothetical protein